MVIQYLLDLYFKQLFLTWYKIHAAVLVPVFESNVS